MPFYAGAGETLTLLHIAQVLLHPEWGSYVYPATLFAKAPPEDLQQAIAAADQLLSGF